MQIILQPDKDKPIKFEDVTDYTLVIRKKGGETHDFYFGDMIFLIGMLEKLKSSIIVELSKKFKHAK